MASAAASCARWPRARRPPWCRVLPDLRPLRRPRLLGPRRAPPALLDGAFSLPAAEGPWRRSAAAERLARRSGGRPGSARSGAADGPHGVRSGSGRPTRAAAAARRACTPSFLPLWCPSLVAMAAAGDSGHGGAQRPGHGGGQAAGRACGRGGLRTAASRGGTAPPRRPSSHRQRTARAQGPCKASWRASAAACARPRRTAASGGVRASTRGHGERRRPRRLGRRGGRTAAARVTGAATMVSRSVATMVSWSVSWSASLTRRCVAHG